MPFEHFLEPLLCVLKTYHSPRCHVKGDKAAIGPLILTIPLEQPNLSSNPDSLSLIELLFYVEKIGTIFNYIMLHTFIFFLLVFFIQYEMLSVVESWQLQGSYSFV